MSDSSIEFSMNYYALKTFGQQQYSNPWAALSELIANGFDANARNVYLYIDMTNKEDSIVEIIDDGCGMDEEDFKTKYVKIGRNRRLENINDRATGRKGIGKLAALYLSNEYQIISVKNKTATAWEVNLEGKKDDDVPRLNHIALEDISFKCIQIWNQILESHGTAIRLLHVNLTRIGDQAINALKHRLSNYFLFDSQNSKLYLCIIRNASDSLSFETIKKEIAFDNMSHIYYSDRKMIETHKDNFIVSISDRNNKECDLSIERKLIAMPESVFDSLSGRRIALSGVSTFNGMEKNYNLNGWIGVHSSIDLSPAKKNDDRFVKNNFYTPNQIRVYVRNKLANENILGRLGLTGTFANYIEGEVAFDILDDNELEDIATTNRQDFSTIDERVTLLLTLLRGLCRQLLSDRQKLADHVNEERNKINKGIQAHQKTNLAKETHQELLSVGLEETKAHELSMVIANKLEGDFDLKTSYKIFISHASKDRIFTDFISHYLQHLGFHWDIDVNKTDIFYTSEGTDITNPNPLPNIIRRMILDDNTDILFLTSYNFLNNQYCLFEGGAAWATRATYEYCLIALDYNSIPAFLTNGKMEFTFNASSKESFKLNKQNYTNIVTILNRLISHLNKNRTGTSVDEVKLIPEPHFDDLVQMRQAGKNLSDYMDPTVLEYWNTYVIDQLDHYLEQLKLEKEKNSSGASSFQPKSL